MKDLYKIEIEVRPPAVYNVSPSVSAREFTQLHIIVWAEGTRFTVEEILQDDFLVSHFDAVVGNAVGKIKQLILKERDARHGQRK